MYLLMTVLALVLLMTVPVAAQAPVSSGKAPATVKDAKDAKQGSMALFVKNDLIF